MEDNKKTSSGSELEESSGRRLRSPAYPVVSLEVALKRADEFFNLERRNSASPAVALKHLGYEPNNSVGIRVLAALKQFGLLKEVEGGKVQLSDLALRILLDKRPGSSEREAALKQAALLPKIHASLKAEWPETLPTDPNLRHELIFNPKWKFNENQVDKFIKEFKDTLTFAKLDPAATMSGEDNNKNGDDVGDVITKSAPTHQSQIEDRKRRPLVQVGTKEDVFTLEEGQAVLQWPSQLTRESYEDFKSWLQLVMRKVERSVINKIEDKNIDS